MLRQRYFLTTKIRRKELDEFVWKDECRAVVRRRRDPLCTKLKTRLQFLGTVPLLTGADRMQDRPWTPCCSQLSFSPPLSVAPFASPFFPLSLRFPRAPPFVLALLPPFAAPSYVMAPGRRHSSRYFLASSCTNARS